ncbi:hypothetical protein [Coleofasciculus sp. A1-SPW-01]|uniref:hypothetical protein n=1 Tax=Coleofasciculus sp. A1-SPW-01 TaxID=3070819 RepID=UPI004064BAC1
MSSFVDTMKQGKQREQGKLGEILAVQLFLPSCASPVTTAKYDRRGEEAKRRAAQRLEF